MQKNNTIDFNKDVVAKVVGNKDNAFNVPLKPAQQISNQLSFDIPPTEDQNWLPNTAEELAKAAYFLCKTVSDDASNKLYKQIKKMVSEENSKEEDNYIVARFQKNESFSKGNNKMKIVVTERKLQEIARKIMKKINFLKEAGEKTQHLAQQPEYKSAFEPTDEELKQIEAEMGRMEEEEEDFDPKNVELSQKEIDNYLKSIGSTRKNIVAINKLRRQRAQEKKEQIAAQREKERQELKDLFAKIRSGEYSPEELEDKGAKKLSPGAQKYKDAAIKLAKERSLQWRLGQERKGWEEKAAKTYDVNKPRKIGSRFIGTFINPKGGWKNAADERLAQKLVKFIEDKGRVPNQFVGTALDKFVRAQEYQQQMPKGEEKEVKLSDVLTEKELQQFSKFSQESPEMMTAPSSSRMRPLPSDIKGRKSKEEIRDEQLFKLAKRASLYDKAIADELAIIKKRKEESGNTIDRGELSRSVEGGEYGGYGPEKFWSLIGATGGIEPQTGEARGERVNPHVVQTSDMTALQGKVILSFSLMKLLPPRLQPMTGDAKGNEFFNKLRSNQSVVGISKRLLTPLGVTFHGPTNRIRTVEEFKSGMAATEDIDLSELSNEDKKLFKNIVLKTYGEVYGQNPNNVEFINKLFGESETKPSVTVRKKFKKAILDPNKPQTVTQEDLEEESEEEK